MTRTHKLDSTFAVSRDVVGRRSIVYTDLFQKAAALLESLARNHPFVDGNKRTAVTATALFLLRNGRRLQTTNEELERFTLMVANERPSLEEIGRRFEVHSVDVA